MKFLILFSVLSVVNVIFSTARSIVTIKGGKLAASLMSAGYFSFYNIMLLYTVADFPMWQKCIVTFIANLVGVYITKLIEEKTQPEKLWKVECTFPASETPPIKCCLALWANKGIDLKYNYNELGTKWVVYNFYCYTKKETKLVQGLVKEFNGKYFISEAKTSF